MARPLLSICVTTYNRAAWLSHSLPLILANAAPYRDLIEVVVCDNASQDDTPAVVRGLARGAELSYHRNEKNVGMLGNLAVSAGRATGRYVWVIGDDDLMVEGAVERVLSAIVHHPRSELLYLNYAYTRFDQPQDLKDPRAVIRVARPISRNFKDEAADRISRIAARNENCFTAIYCLIFREEHARLVYGQDTSGEPFTSLRTCVPTSDYVVRRMFDKPGCWIGDPCVVVNMNVSWMRYADLFILERFPELFDLMQEKGAPQEDVDGLRTNHLPHLLHWFGEVYTPARRENLAHFSARRLVERFRALPAFRREWPRFLEVYRRAFGEGRTGAEALSPERLNDVYMIKSQETVP